MPARAPRAGGPIAVRIERVDAYGFRVADPDSVAARTPCRCDTLAARGVRLVEGEGWLYLRAAARGKRPALRRNAVELTLRSRGLPPVAARIPGQDSAATPVRGAWLVRDDADTLVGPPFAWRPAGATWLNADGFAALAVDSQGVLRLPSLAGYRPVAGAGSGSRTDTLRIASIAGGVLHGRRITLDPEGGGDDAAGQGPDGTRASHLNLECARILAGLLEAAGAQVRLTREGDLSVSEVERVQLSEAFRADRFLRIGHRAAKVGFYFSSAAGRRWAERTVREMERLGLPSPAVGDDAAYPLAQTSCPALNAAPAALGQPGVEARLLAPGALRTEAWALFLGLAREWAPEAAWPVDSLEVRDAGGAPVGGAAVTLGAALVVETDALGRARFARTEPGPIEAEVNDPRASARVVLLESQRGAVLTGGRGR
jgi:N-acetylmuramoyl-L-alanine amidase